MLSPHEVTACLVTRGDQPDAMQRIVESLIFPRVVVWDNSQREDWKCAGRYKAAHHLAKTALVYFQDDDVIVPEATQEALLREYHAEDCLAVYGHGDNPDGYDDLPLVCGGAIARRESCLVAMWRYGKRWPLDDAFKYEADFVVGALYGHWRHLHEPFYIDLEIAQSPERLCNQPWQRDLKYEVTERARAIRDELVAA